eukprot:2798763-Amphidinium_carterae.1
MELQASSRDVVKLFKTMRSFDLRVLRVCGKKGCQCMPIIRFIPMDDRLKWFQRKVQALLPVDCARLTCDSPPCLQIASLLDCQEYWRKEVPLQLLFLADVPFTSRS